MARLANGQGLSGRDVRSRYTFGLSTECDESPSPLLREGIAQFNRGEYFEQHETLELLWRGEQREVRRLYQGILQIGVAFHHLRRRNYHGTVYMLTRGAHYLTPFSPRCQDVERLLIDATTALRAVERLGQIGSGISTGNSCRGSATRTSDRRPTARQSPGLWIDIGC